MEEDYSSVKFDFVTERQEIEIGIRVNFFRSITEQVYKLQYVVEGDSSQDISRDKSQLT